MIVYAVTTYNAVEAAGELPVTTLCKGMTQNNGLLAVRAGRNDVDWTADQLFNAFDISTGIGWQLLKRGCTNGRFRPARQCFVYRGDIFKRDRVG